MAVGEHLAIGDIAISVSDLVVAFGSRVVIDRLSLDVRRGEILGLVGGSGSGKSVLLRAIIGLLPKRQGRIEVLGSVLDDVELATTACDRAAVRSLVPARRAFLLADGASERRLSDARKP